MKKMNIKENGNFKVISHNHVLYGNKQGNYCYIHFEEKARTCYMISSFPWADVLRLVRGKINWKEFAWVVSYENSMQEEFQDYYNL